MASHAPATAERWQRLTTRGGVLVAGCLVFLLLMLGYASAASANALYWDLTDGPGTPTANYEFAYGDSGDVNLSGD